MMTFNPYSTKFVTTLCELAIIAGANTMRHYCTELNIQKKKDESPVTIADREGEKIITEGLLKLCPEIQVIGEEASSHHLPQFIEEYFFLLDPLDGTKEFINKRPEFTVNIGLIKKNKPIVGIVYAPALERLFFTLDSDAAFELKIIPSNHPIIDLKQAQRINHNVQKNIDDMHLLTSGSRIDLKKEMLLSSLNPRKITSMGSSLKFCLIATGEADLYPRYGRTMEWDTAAAHAILSNVGGHIVDLYGKELTYGKIEHGLDNPSFFAFVNKSFLNPSLMEEMIKW